MKEILLVGVGGGLGAIARMKFGGLVLHHWPNWRFPISTFAVNTIGCLMAGFLSGLVIKQDWFTEQTRLFLFTGLLGGFTTFSAFGVDTVTLLQRGEVAVALAYAVLSVAVGVAALWLALAVIPHAR
ncbi:MAG: fluoride efflux transporter CrcB [Planctomycetes bacterium]|nr:fluoride efflux transporter CrcB [Planctomycetota bacterium]